MKTKKTIPYAKLVRSLLQLVCFLLIPGLFIQSFQGIRSLVTGLVTGSMTGVAQALFPTVLLVLVTAVFGRFFCGNMCAFGTLEDAVAFLGHKVLHLRFRMPEKADARLKKLKYVVLAALVVGWIFGVDLLRNANPWDAFAAMFTLPPAFSYAFGSLLLGSVLLIAILIASLFVERFFCRYLCPMGAVFSLVSRLRILKIRKPRRDCGSCRLCTRSCKMGISLYRSDKVSSGECVDCMQCVYPCPRHNVHPAVGASDVAPLLASVAVASTIGLYYVGNLGVNALSVSSPASSVSETVPQSETALSSADTETLLPEPTTAEPTTAEPTTAEPTTAETTTAAQSASGYKDGTYQGSGTGHKGGTTTVSVTIQNGQITDVTTVSTRDDAEFYNRAFSTVVAEIISGQKTSVNAVSGATHSSSGIMAAVADALTQAKA